jgi:MarR family transcriptional regulator, organic hydroperoxide resistance regulator
MPWKQFPCRVSGVDDGEDRATTGALVWRLAMRWRVALDRAVAPLGLTQPQYTVLASLRGLTARPGAERPSQRRLAEVTGLEPIYVSKLVAALERSGLVERARDAGDARVVRLALTARGTEVVDEAVGVVQRLQRELTAPLGGPDARRTRELRAALRALLDDEPQSTGDEP